MGIYEYINRWRHTRGYGVHSPLAYRIVKECIRPDERYGFYSDAYIDYEFRKEGKVRQNARMLIRLINLLHPKRIWIPNCDKRIKTALGISFPNIHFTTHKDCPKDADMIVDFGDNDCGNLWKRFDGKSECSLVSFTKNRERTAVDGPTLTLQAKDYSIMLRREGMDTICYSLL